MGQSLSDTNLVAASMTSSALFTKTGYFLQPGDFNIRTRSFSVSCRTLGGHMSILVTTTNTGTERARARPKCSLVIPTIPALAPTINIPKSGACPVMPKTVVFKYFSWPARSMKVITLELFSQTRTQSRLP